MVSATPHLPSDMVFEFLTRTSCTKTLDGCKCVSKEWNGLILHDSSFRRTYCQRTKTLQGYVVEDMFGSKILSSNIKFSSAYDTEILAACNQGILVLNCKRGVSFGDSRYYVCKPTTGQLKQIPTPDLECATDSFAIMALLSPELHYKIIRLLSENNDGRYKVEIFHSDEWCWREEEGLLLTLPDDEFIDDYLRPAVTASKSVHWLTNRNNVVSLSMENRNTSSFRRFAFPEQGRDSTCKLLEYQGKLGFISITQDENVVELWVRNAKRDQWEKKMVINLEGDVETVDASTTGCYNGDIAFEKRQKDEYIFCEIEDYCKYRVKKVEESYSAREIFQFRSDFEPVSLTPT